MTNKELIRKADLALTELTSAGGVLNPEQEAAFFRKMIAQPTIMQDARIIFMSSPKREINKIGFGSRILRKGTSATALVQGDRAKPDLDRITLDSKEVMAEVQIPYDVIEDNIEREAMSDTVVTLMSERAALDVEELIVQGDTALVGSDPYLGCLDGVLKQADVNVVNAGGATITKTVFKNGLKAMPDEYMRIRSSMRHYVSIDNETQYRDTIADRQTAMGDSHLSGMSPVFAFGAPVIPVAMMPGANGLFLDPKNIIVGFHRRVQIETDKDIQKRIYIIVLTMRLDVILEEKAAVVKYTNIGS
jgi:HK97 family phage major capsid protein